MTVSEVSHFMAVDFFGIRLRIEAVSDMEISIGRGDFL